MTETAPPYYQWSPLPSRSPLRWPNKAPLAVGAVVLLEHYEWEPPEDAYTLRTASGGLIKLPDPDYVRLTHREYGHRVGIFRVLDALDKFQIPPTIAVDVLTAQNYPWLIDHCLNRGCEVIGHGIAASRLMTSKLSKDQEIAMIETSLDVLESAIGSRPTGWFSPEGVESARTPALLADAGVRFVCDWPNDEQPYEMITPTGSLVSVPLTLEIDDEFALWTRRMRLQDWARAVSETAEGLATDGVENGRSLVLTLRPWLIGQPFRMPHLETALASIDSTGETYKTSVGEIAASVESNRRADTTNADEIQ